MPHLLVFDSGIGGLGVVAELRRLWPEAGITYLADNGFYPYGEKPDEVLVRRILEVVGQGVEIVKPDAVVVACNTASTIALAALRAGLAVPVVGCVPPVKPAAAASQTRHIGLLATPATIRRRYLQRLINDFADGCAVHSLGTPVLADLAEKKFRGQGVEVAVLTAAVAPLFERGAAIDAVALGCTHYTFLLPELRALYPAVLWFDPAEPVARQTMKVAAGLGDAGGGSCRGTAFFTRALPDVEVMRGALRGFGFGVVRVVGLP